jgi:hypothetical protein
MNRRVIQLQGEHKEKSVTGENCDEIDRIKMWVCISTIDEI